MNRHTGPNPVRPRYARLGWAVAAVVGALAVGPGCHHRSAPPPGGATNSKAQAARKQAETCAVDAVKAVAAAEVAAHPESRKRGVLAAAAAKLHLDRVHLFDKSASKVSAEVTPALPTPPPVPPVVSKPALPSPPAMDRSDRVARRSSSPVVIRERVVSEIPYRTEAEAEGRVLRDAQNVIERKLKELDPPVVYRPSIAEVKYEYVRRESRLVRPPTLRETELINEIGYDRGGRQYVEYTVEVTADQVRELRARDRLLAGVKVVGIVAAVALAGFLFLRLDEWTKGYLTSWLAFGAAALAGGIATALVLV